MITDIYSFTQSIVEVVKAYYKNNPTLDNYNASSPLFPKYIAEYILRTRYGILRNTGFKVLDLVLTNNESNHIYKKIEAGHFGLKRDVILINKEIDKIKENNILTSEQNILFGFIYHTLLDYYKDREFLERYNLRTLSKQKTFLAQYLVYFSVSTYCGTFDRLKRTENVFDSDFTTTRISFLYTKMVSRFKKQDKTSIDIYNELLNFFNASKFKEYFNHIKHIEYGHSNREEDKFNG